MDTLHCASIGLGANLGDASATLRQTLAELATSDGIEALRASAFYRSAPVDASGPDYINAAALVYTRLSPLTLLDLLQTLEQRHGRQRPYHHAPRTLDLDLLHYDQQILIHPRLTLPHPRLSQRAFVLLPLLDLCTPGPVTTPQADALGLDATVLQRWLADCGDQRIERLSDTQRLPTAFCDNS